MPDLKDVIARIRGSTGAQTAVEALATGQPFIAGRAPTPAEAITPGTDPAVIVGTVVAGEQLPDIPVALGPRPAHPHDLTLAQALDCPAELLGAEEIDAYNSGELSEDLESAVRRAFTAHVHERESTGGRVVHALAGPTELGMGWTWCPACYPDETLGEILAANPGGPALSLEYDIALHCTSQVRARCTAGCEPRDIADALARLVRRTEHQAQASAQTRATNTLAESVRYTARIGNAAPQRWVVPGFVAQDGLTILGGTSGDGKTFSAMYAAVCVAAGARWFGRPTTQTRTLLLPLEGGTTDHCRRIGALAAGLDIAPADLDGRLDVYPTHGFQADDPAQMDELIRLITTLGHGFVVIDNLTQARANTDENNAANLGAALRPLAALAHDRQVGILLIHHANAKGELRGSSAIRQHADMVFETKRENATNHALIVLSRTKDRYGKSLERLRYRFLDSVDPDTGETVAIIAAELDPARPDPASVTPVIPDPADPETRPKRAKAEPIDVPLTPKNRARMTDLLGMLPLSSTGIYERLGGSRTYVISLRNQLERDGKIVCREGVWHKV